MSDGAEGKTNLLKGAIDSIRKNIGSVKDAAIGVFKTAGGEELPPELRKGRVAVAAVATVAALAYGAHKLTSGNREPEQEQGGRS